MTAVGVGVLVSVLMVCGVRSGSLFVRTLSYSNYFRTISPPTKSYHPLILKIMIQTMVLRERLSGMFEPDMACASAGE